MRRSRRVALLVAAGWLLAVFPVPVRAQDAGVTFLDELGEGQVDEIIAVWTEGRLLGTLHVSPDHPHDSFTAPVEPGVLSYSLCGILRRRGANGMSSSHVIDNGGRVAVRPGLMLRAMTMGDVVFSLEADGVPSEIGDTQVCPAAIS